MGMDPAEDSDNVENGPKIHTIIMDSAPAFHNVATTTPPRDFMGTGIASTI
jgi:hypothetical protein